MKGPLGGLRSLVWQGVTAAYWKSLPIPVIPSAHLATPIVTRGEGSFSYQGVSTRGALSGTSVWRPQSRYTVSRTECRI